MLCGCSTLTSISVTTELPASLRQPCEPLPDLAGGDRLSVFLWGRQVIAAYNDCADRHDATVQAWPR